jgi:hypothetical protein
MALSFPTSPTSGQVYVAPNGVVYTWNNTVGVWTATGSTVGSIISGTVQNVTGATVSFTGIPAGVKRITVMLYEGSTVAGTDALVQLGTSAGYVTTGYNASWQGGTAQTGSSTAGIIFGIPNGTNTPTFVMTITNITGNLWVAAYTGKLNAGNCLWGGGDVALPGVLDSLRLNANGTTFDNGQVNIFYEF